VHDCQQHFATTLALTMMTKQWKDTRQQWQDIFHCSEHHSFESLRRFGFPPFLAAFDFLYLVLNQAHSILWLM
jgi:hypothetical protein